MAGIWHTVLEEIDGRIAKALARIGVTGSTINAGGLSGQLPPSVLPPGSGGGSAAPGTYLVSGGRVTWITGLQFAVAAGSGYINGALRSWAAQTVTLAAADPTDPRIDVIYVGLDGVADSITGTAAPDPSEPVTDPATQIRLALVTVSAGATEPDPVTITTEIVYAEQDGPPGEWTWSSSGSGWTLASTNNPRTGSRDIEGTSVAANAYVQAQRGSGTISPTQFEQLVIFQRFKATWGNNRFLQISLRLNGVLVGNALRVSDGYFGLDQTNVATYQAVIIPTLQFAAPASAQFNQIRIQAIGTGGTAIGVYLDDISLTNGGITMVGGGLSQAEADARYLQRTTIEREFDAILTDDDFNVLVDDDGNVLRGDP